MTNIPSYGCAGFTFLDVREKEEFEAAHLPDAINIPLGHLITIVAKHGEEILQPLRTGNVLVYCNTGYRADIAAHEMKKVRPITFPFPRYIFLHASVLTSLVHPVGLDAECVVIERRVDTFRKQMSEAALGNTAIK